MEDEIKNKNYVIVAMAGHTGSGKFRPILHWVNEYNQLEANELVRSFPRIKRDQKYAIIASNECTYHEGLMVKMINDKDPFLTENNNSENDSKSINKRSAVDKMINLYRKTRDPKYLDPIKTKIDYPFEDQILQRFCAPTRIRNEIVYDKNYDMHAMLSEYFTYYVKKYALSPMPRLDADLAQSIKNKNWVDPSQEVRYEAFMKDKTNRIRMLILYNGLFGENNSLGVEFDGKRIRYVSTCGTKEEINVPQGKPTNKDNKYVFKIKKLLTETGKIEPVYAQDNQLSIE